MISLETLTHSLGPFCTVVLTGTAGDGQYYKDLEAVVATVSFEEPQALKVWPQHWDGKLWFSFANITELKVLDCPG